jgi:hypothetical protein
MIMELNKSPVYVYTRIRKENRAELERALYKKD